MRGEEGASGHLGAVEQLSVPSEATGALAVLSVAC